ncbi:hypothetical protein B0T18DRAFT_405589 [Schizothecium vesticola]|uniref:TRI14-like protein n=1 Tax=Schizothecium vesticola TaxID=314040 RepID=A0AA40K7N0_9PEZI|nr:hypothetical protein B0T18DRAFT_405589 [Schizothecium vesticola]
MSYLFALACVLLSGARATPPPASRHCPPFSGGSFVIDRFQLYPENADWDGNRCVLYLSVLFNASVAVYDPYLASIVDVVSFPGLTGRPNLSASGITWDKRTGLVSAILNSPTPFLTAGQNVSGDNFLVRYDPLADRVLWSVNLTAVSGGAYGGFQEVEHDARGNAYIAGTHPSSIIKIDKHGQHAAPWYLPDGPLVTGPRGYSGLASTGDVLLANDNKGGTGGEIHRFDMRDPKGRPVVVPRTPNVFIPDANGIYMPPKYRGTVLLVAINTVGVVVLRSKDGTWRTAEHLGTVANNVTLAGSDAIVPTAVQVGESVYMVELYFAGTIVPGTNAGNRTLFPMYDITNQLEALCSH